MKKISLYLFFISYVPLITASNYYDSKKAFQIYLQSVPTIHLESLIRQPYNHNIFLLNKPLNAKERRTLKRIEERNRALKNAAYCLVQSVEKNRKYFSEAESEGEECYEKEDKETTYNKSKKKKKRKKYTTYKRDIPQLNPPKKPSVLTVWDCAVITKGKKITKKERKKQQTNTSS